MAKQKGARPVASQPRIAAAGKTAEEAESELSLAWLESFVALERFGNQIDAGLATDRTQPTISKHIGSLEAWLRFKLVKRANPLELTRRGAAFLHVAHVVIKLLEGSREYKRAPTSMKHFDMDAFLELKERQRERGMFDKM